ncbi:unnamed protein product [Ophioblennius macclurei]
MKRKNPQSDKPSPEGLSADYVVGQVSGSLFSQSSAPSGSLSALFNTSAPAAPLRFRPPPKPVPTSTQSTEKQRESPEDKPQPGQKKKKQLKEKSAADLRVENRESGLQEADQEERGQSAAKRSKLRESGNENQHWVLRRQRLKASRQEEALKAKRTVFVGNLPISCTKKTLRSIFKGSGVIESIRFRSVVREDPSMTRKLATIKRKTHPKKQSMNAYVVFKDDDGATKALEKNGIEMEKDFHIRVDGVADTSSHDHRRSVFVGNLSFEMKEADFRQHFYDCGDVEAVRLVRDRNTGMGKGFGYVLFQSADSVQLALELDGSKLEGRSIRVKRSVKKEKNKGGKEAPQRTGKGPGQKAGGSKFQKTLPGKQQTSTKGSFKGEMADPKKKAQKKGLKKKKKMKPNRSAHT